MPIFTSETLKQQIQTGSLQRLLKSITAKDSQESILELVMPLNDIKNNPPRFLYANATRN